MKTYVIRLTSNDDVLSILEKINWARESRTLLIFPEDENLVIDRLDLALMLRRSQEMGTQLAILTDQEEVTQYARELGIPVYQSAQEALFTKWRRGRGRKRFLRRHVSDTSNLFGKKELVEAERQAQPDNLIMRAGGLVLGLVILILAVMLFLPGAKIILDMAEQRQQLTMDILISPKLTGPNLSGGVPGETVSVWLEAEDQTASTGRVQLPSQSAVGMVYFTNLTDEEVEIPSGTIVMTENKPPVRFKTQRTVTVEPEKNSITAVPVQAANPGSQGNVEAEKIIILEGALGAQVSVINKDATSGGADEEALQPTQEDYSRLKTRMLKYLEENAWQELKSKQPADQIYLKPTLSASKNIKEERFPAAGMAGDQLKLKLQVEYTVLSVSLENIRKLAKISLDTTLPTGYSSNDQNIQVDTIGYPQVEQDIVHWQVQASRNIIPVYTRSKVAPLVLGTSTRNAEKVLQQTFKLREKAQIDMFPSWWNWMPVFPFRIEVVTR